MESSRHELCGPVRLRRRLYLLGHAAHLARLLALLLLLVRFVLGAQRLRAQHRAALPLLPASAPNHYCKYTLYQL